MITPELLPRIYTEDIYVVHDRNSEEIDNSVSTVKSKEKDLLKPTELSKKEVKVFEHVVLSDIEPTPDQKELLSKILQAIGLTLEKIKLIVGIEYPAYIKARNLISFNVSSVEISSAEKYKVLESEFGKILLSDSLAVLETDVPRKKALWQALQKMYVD
jgi:DNA polymerase III psi subunit